ncbi:MAG: hypothetical protein H6737_21575 [Alphaproteobacteria bacterium]|nr:hypothetical protein [Alphaproteobacteria bacterium]
MSTSRVGSPLSWGRDFAVVGCATGALAPFFVIFDPLFAVAAGFAGAASGFLLGVAAGWTVEQTRGHVPIPVLVACMAVAGSLWGAATGTVGGAASLWFGIEGAPLGFVLGATTGMVQLGLFFLPYLVLRVRGESARPAVIGAVLAAPFMGWLGLAALAASTFGLWLFALPAAVWLGIAIDRSHRRDISTETSEISRLSRRPDAHLLRATSRF